MGGVAGAAIAPVIAHLAREKGTFTVALLATPFSFEGRRPLKAARGVLVMRANTDLAVVRCNDAAIPAVPGGISRLQAYKTTNDAIINDAHAVLSLVGGTYPLGLARPGVMPPLRR